MGVKTPISLKELNKKFPFYGFTTLTPTSFGVMDTTYIVATNECSYIVKKYERDIKAQIENDKKLLQALNTAGLNVPLYLQHNDGWYLYSKLKGTSPAHIQMFHIQALARFLAKLHKYTYKKHSHSSFIQNYNIQELLTYTKANFYSFYKKLQHLKSYKMADDGFIHGDIFKDNTVFDAHKIGVFDFIDSGSGSFCFDAAVSLVGFDVLRGKKLFIKIFFNTYNQHAPKKLTQKELLYEIKIASSFYALLRIDNYKSTAKAKELLR